jgi:FkbM family methyltransferase
MIPIEISLLLKNGFRNSSAMDIGANAGYWTLPLAQTFLKVYAFEPNHNVRKKLLKNIELNAELAKRILISPDAVGRESNIIDFYEISLIDGDGLYNNGLSGTFNRGLKIEPCKVNQVTFDSYISVVKKLDFMKIDVEGMEYSVLSGARELIRSFGPIVFWEASFSLDAAQGTHNIPNSLAFLSAEGYTHYSYVDGKFKKMANSSHHLSGIDDCDILSVPEKSLHLVSNL